MSPMLLNFRIVKVKLRLLVPSARIAAEVAKPSLIENTTPCHDAQVVGSYWVSNSLRLTILIAKSEDCTTAPQHPQKSERDITDIYVKQCSEKGKKYHKIYVKFPAV